MQIQTNKHTPPKLRSSNCIVWLLLAVTSVLGFVNRIENSIDIKQECIQNEGRKVNGFIVCVTKNRINRTTPSFDFKIARNYIDVARMIHVP